MDRRLNFHIGTAVAAMVTLSCAVRPVDRVVMPVGSYRTDLGRSMATKYRADLERLFADIKREPSLSLVDFTVFALPQLGSGIFFARNEEDPEIPYLMLVMYSPMALPGTTEDERILTATRMYIRPLVATVVTSQKDRVLADRGVKGVGVVFSWAPMVYGNSRSESVTAFFGTETCKKALDSEDGWKELIRSGTIQFTAVDVATGLIVGNARRRVKINPDAPLAAETAAEQVPDRAPEELARLKESTQNVQLVIESWNWSQLSNFAQVEGLVTNVSTRSLKNVQAVAIFKTSEGTFITSDSSLVEFNPILPGQSSPFKVLARWNPAMHSASLSFKQLLGGSLQSMARKNYDAAK